MNQMESEIPYMPNTFQIKCEIAYSITINIKISTVTIPIITTIITQIIKFKCGAKFRNTT